MYLTSFDGTSAVVQVGSRQAGRQKVDTVHLSCWSKWGDVLECRKDQFYFHFWEVTESCFLATQSYLPLQKHPQGLELLLFKQAPWKWEIKLHHADQWALQRASAPKRCDLALQVLANNFVLRPLGLQIGSLSASQPLKGAFKSLPAAMHSLNDLFIC